MQTKLKLCRLTKNGRSSCLQELSPTHVIITVSNNESQTTITLSRHPRIIVTIIGINPLPDRYAGKGCGTSTIYILFHSLFYLEQLMVWLAPLRETDHYVVFKINLWFMPLLSNSALLVPVCLSTLYWRKIVYFSSLLMQFWNYQFHKNFSNIKFITTRSKF